MWSAVIFFYAFLLCCSCILMYNCATVVLCEYHSEQLLWSIIQQALDCLHAGVVGAW